MITSRRFNRDAPVFLWYHDWYDSVGSVTPLKKKLQSQLRADAHVLLHNLGRVTAVGVSRVHAQNLRDHLAEARTVGWLAPRVRVDFVYNPVAENLTRSEVPYDPTKLVFFSAAWKGLDMVLSAFEAVRKAMPDMRLYVASPGYDYDVAKGRADENVTFLGKLSHAEVIDEVRSALCVFYPANVVPETFGIVFAESHAIGTPVLAHPFGAATELLSADELVDANDIDAVVKRVRAWREGARPVVSSRSELALSNVVDAWERLLFPDGSSRRVAAGTSVAPIGLRTAGTASSPAR
jgi:glycosyltransferase involved in cell wall biosynthesis